MMSMDRKALAEYFEGLADKYYGFEIVERLENAGILDVYDVIACLDEYIINGKEHLKE